jgi:hypothetical protein
VVLSEDVVDVSGDLNDFGSFLSLRLFRLRFYKSFEDGKLVYCVGLVVKCQDPDGWVAVWRRCYDSMDKARELFAGVEPLARNRLEGLLLIELVSSDPNGGEVVVD